MPRKREKYEGQIFQVKGSQKGGTRKASNGRTKKTGRGEQVVVVVDGGNGKAVPHLGAPSSSRSRGSGARPVGSRHKKPSWVGQLPSQLGHLAWKYRWYLTPFVALVLAAYLIRDSALLGVFVAVALGGVFYALSKAEITVGKRKWLSQRERLLVAYWAAGVAVAALVETVSPDESMLRLAIVLSLATTWQTWQWLTSRRPGAGVKGKLSKEGAARLKLWDRVSKYSEGTLKGSHVVGGTAKEPSSGTLVFTVQLRADVHGESAQNEVVWKKVEALCAFPPKTVRIKCDKVNSTRVLVTMSVSKHLELNTVTWPGPELTADGQIPLGDTPAGATVVIPRHDEKGVRHGRVSGNTGNGKTSTARVILTAKASAMTSVGPADTRLAFASDDDPPRMFPEEVLFLIDGKRGTSMPEVSNIFDWYAVTDDEWPAVLDTVYNIMLARQLRRGKQKKSAWRTGTEEDPVITLYVAEASAVRRSLKERGLIKKYDARVLEMLQHGRALGVCIWEEAQDAIAENWLGGRQARELMSKGAAVLHRPGGSTGQQYAGDGASERQLLLKLPEAEGFAAVIVNGQPVADIMRVRWASEEGSGAWCADYIPRCLAGEDLTVAGQPYERRTQGREDLNDMAQQLVGVGADGSPTGSHSESQSQSHSDPTHARAPARVEAPSSPNGTGTGTAPTEDAVPPTDTELAQGADWVMKQLGLMKAGLTAAQLIERGKGQRGRSRTSIFRNLAQLKEAGEIEQRGDVYVINGR